MLKVQVPIVSPEKCVENYKGLAQITDNQLCAGGQNWQDSCGGDSGGPLILHRAIDSMLTAVQYGIVSFGPKLCGRENFPGVYTRVVKYLDWILDNIKP